MYQNLNCIALRTVKYSDRNSILTVYTRQEGRLAFLVPAGRGREANRLRALLMPMGRFECVADLRSGRDIHPIRDVKPTGQSSVGDPLRSTISLFIADLLTGLLREPMADPLLFDFIDRSIQVLNDDATTGVANFHITFLLLISRFLGIEPDWGSYLPGRVFDMAEGIFRSSPPNHRNFLPSSDSEILYKLRRLSYRNMRLWRLTRFERNRLLDLILHYYRIHYPSQPTLQSLPILRLMAD